MNTKPSSMELCVYIEHVKNIDLSCMTPALNHIKEAYILLLEKELEKMDSTPEEVAEPLTPPQTQFTFKPPVTPKKSRDQNLHDVLKSPPGYKFLRSYLRISLHKNDRKFSFREKQYVRTLLLASRTFSDGTEDVDKEYLRQRLLFFYNMHRSANISANRSRIKKTKGVRNLFSANSAEIS